MINAQIIDSTSSNDVMLQEIISRIEGVEELVASELNTYRNAPAEQAQACLTTIVIPVYNEIDTVTRVVSRVAALPINKEILIVDDCSTDGTVEILKRLEDIEGIKLILKSENEGKGAALRTGFDHAKGDIVVIQDADLEYDPLEIPSLLGPILRDEADIVYGSRFLEHTDTTSKVHRWGNGLLTKLSNLFSGLKLTDMETCYKAFRGDALNSLEVIQNRFGVEPELTAKLARRGYRFMEVPISYNPRSYAEGKKIGVKDLFKAFWCIGRYGISD